MAYRQLAEAAGDEPSGKGLVGEQSTETMLSTFLTVLEEQPLEHWARNEMYKPLAVKFDGVRFVDTLWRAALRVSLFGGITLSVNHYTGHGAMREEDWSHFRLTGELKARAKKLYRAAAVLVRAERKRKRQAKRWNKKARREEEREASRRARLEQLQTTLTRATGLHQSAKERSGHGVQEAW